MICHGEPPYLEASSAGDTRFSAFFARVSSRGFTSIEELYQSAKEFPDGKPKHWKDAKGRRALNQEDLIPFYQSLWEEYIDENQYLIPVLVAATGISDKFGRSSSVCQATCLWGSYDLGIFNIFTT